MVSSEDKRLLIKEYESRKHPCTFAKKSVTAGYPALYWLCNHPKNLGKLCCMGADPEEVLEIVKKCELNK